jgi:hypothetical protein
MAYRKQQQKHRHIPDEISSIHADIDESVVSNITYNNDNNDNNDSIFTEQRDEKTRRRRKNVDHKDNENQQQQQQQAHISVSEGLQQELQQEMSQLLEPPKTSRFRGVLIVILFLLIVMNAIGMNYSKYCVNDNEPCKSKYLLVSDHIKTLGEYVKPVAYWIAFKLGRLADLARLVKDLLDFIWDCKTTIGIYQQYIQCMLYSVWYSI